MSDGTEALPVDLVLDNVPRIERPVEVAPGIWVDTPHEILVNKLTALLSRWAVRDLIDVRALEASGLDLQRALADAPKKDSGFSPPTLAWVLDTLPTNELDASLRQYREALVARLLSEGD
ncbi:MAG: nucleotidyl transferase AbiEii/AbiGii toxin family protein [Myxococcota bacterium]